MSFKLIPLRIVPDNTSLDFMKLRNLNLAGSIILIIISCILITIKGFNLGIDFSGGILIEARSNKKVDLSELRVMLHALDIGEISLQDLGSDKDFMIKVGENKKLKLDTNTKTNLIKKTLQEILDEGIEYRKIDFVGPQVGKELVTNSIIATILSFIAIMIYVWIRFEWQYSMGIVFALLHDTAITLGFISLFNIEFNLTIIAAILTIIGYSVNDSVVIYDRIRENIRKYKKASINELINSSINETLSRTTLTLLTTLLSLMALIIYGGEVIKGFSIIVSFGIIAGTYSSIYISAPILTFFNIDKLVSKSKNK